MLYWLQYFACGDRGTGTDEAAAVADLMTTFDPHYSILWGMCTSSVTYLATLGSAKWADSVLTRAYR
jgi:hypothetical protein